MKLKKHSEPAIVMLITLAFLLLLTSPLWIGWIMEYEHNKTRDAIVGVNLQCPQGTVEKREVWSKLGIAIFCEKEGIKHGVWQAWDGGYMHIEGQYTDGHKDGVWKYFNAREEQWGRRTYALGKETSGLVNLLTADTILLKIDEGKLHLMKNSRPYRSYGVRLGTGGTASGKSPDGRSVLEGAYLLGEKNEDGEGRKSLVVSNAGLQEATGQEKHFTIKAHPNRMGWAWQLTGLWGATKSSVAVSHKDMDEIWELVESGIPFEALL